MFCRLLKKCHFLYEWCDAMRVSCTRQEFQIFDALYPLFTLLIAAGAIAIRVVGRCTKGND
jgi:hypothetical protein